MKLLGAREFLKTVKPGTLCCEFWLKEEEDCLDLINMLKTKSDLAKALVEYGGEFYIYGDNSGSVSFLVDDLDEPEAETIDGVLYNCIFYYDKNIIGDASPWTTLQVVFETEDEWPDVIPVEVSDQILKKEDIKRIQKRFLKEYGATFGIYDAWALEKLEKDKNYDTLIINHKGEIK